MENSNKKKSTIFPHAWFKSLEKLPDDIAGRIYKAVQRLDITGEMTKFEEGSIEDILFSQFAYQTDEFGNNYAQTCENRSKAAKKREAEKAQRAQTKSLVDDRSGVDRIGKDRIGEDVSGGGRSGEEKSTTTTTAEIIEVWNQQKCTQNIKIIGEQRRERTEIAVAVSGGSEPFLDMIRSLDGQAYFKNHKVDYDWFVDPKNFQNILEGKYADSFQNIPDGWEVIK